jgi:hypothetical protein
MPNDQSQIYFIMEGAAMLLSGARETRDSADPNCINADGASAKNGP